MKPTIVDTEAVDRWGIIVSTVCAVHCLVTPVFALFIPAGLTSFTDSLIHRFLLVIVLGLVIASLYRCYMTHRNLKPVILGTVGVCLLAVGAFHDHSIHHGHFHFADWMAGVGVNIAGSLLVLAGHILNIRQCRCLKSNHGVCGENHSTEA